MNRLILIGNGFDLAHGLKTSYNDFILWYMKSSFVSASKSNFTDTLMDVRRSRSLVLTVDTVESLVETYYKNKFEQILPSIASFGWDDRLSKEPFTVNIKSELLRILLTNCSYTTWVDIEREFYELLKGILGKSEDYSIKQQHLAELNESLNFIISKLGEYLKQLPASTYDDRYHEIFKPRLKKFDILLPWSEGPQWRSEDRFEIQRTCVLNFNYTPTAEQYIHSHESTSPFEIINIHGQLDDEDNSNPIIFGFGDELDDDYLKMERERAKGYFKFIKSFWYFRTSNYWNLIRFIDSSEYQIHVLGHSCGLSDRTMLHMILEHDNCKSIKIFYHGDAITNNYNETTYEVARHFNDKALMRRRIVPFNQSERIPQFNDARI